MLFPSRNVFWLLCVLFSFLAKGQESGKPSPDPLVIVHGAYGGSWAFKEVDSLLTLKGLRVHRPSLTGLGERAHLASPEINLSTHIQDIVNYILFEDLQNIVLLGHSYGGMVITGVANQLPERIKKLIYLDAFVPQNGESVLDLLHPERADAVKKDTREGFIFPHWLKKESKPPTDVPQPLKTFTERLYVKKNTSVLPGTYILTVEQGKNWNEDHFSNAAKRAKLFGWKYYEMSGDHNPHWSQQNELIDLLLEIYK